MKHLKTIVYPAAAVVGLVTGALIARFALHMDVIMVVAVGIMADIVAGVVARGVVHVATKDLGAPFLASFVWHAVTAALVVWFVFNTSEAVQTTLTFAILASTANALGFRFIISEDKADTMPSRRERIAELAATLRYRMMDDGITPNLNAPLCVDPDGNHLTPAEADARGLGALYGEALEYIKTLV